MIEFKEVNWYFLLSILVAKLIVFAAVGVLTMFLSRPMHLGKVGIYSIFATQSNDIALGYPISKCQHCTWLSYQEVSTLHWVIPSVNGGIILSVSVGYYRP